MAIETVQDLFIDELKDIYSAEKQAVRIYPRIAKAIQSEELKGAVQAHLEETKVQVERLDRIFEILGKRAAGKTCEGMKGVLAETSEALENSEQGSVRDAAIIGAAQRAEHYEIAAYGTVMALAKSLGQSEILELLSQTLEEEKATDKKLTGISRVVNKQAMTESGSEDEEDADVSDSEEAEGMGLDNGDTGSARPAAKKGGAKSKSQSRGSR